MVNPRLVNSGATSSFTSSANELLNFWNSSSLFATGTRAVLTPCYYESKKKRMMDVLAILTEVKIGKKMKVTENAKRSTIDPKKANGTNVMKKDNE